MSSFIVIDVETANARMDSICQIGIAKYDHSALAEEWVTLVNPNQHFDYFNIQIHGITPEMVKDAPSFEEVYAKLYTYLHNSISISHTSFDKTSITLSLGCNFLPLGCNLGCNFIIKRIVKHYM